MMKKFSIVSLVVSGAMIFSIAGFGCKKTEQPAEAPKPVEQVQAPAPVVVEGFEVTNGTLEKGGTGFILSSNQDILTVALKKTPTSYNNVMTIKCKIKPQYNGFIVFGETPQQTAKAGLRVPVKLSVIEGPFLSKKEMPWKFEKDKIYDTELKIDLAQKNIVWKVEGKEVKTKITAPPASINYVGYSIWNGKTEFGDLQISGE